MQTCKTQQNTGLDTVKNLFPVCFYSNAPLWLPWCTDKRLWNAWRSSTPGGNSRCVSWSHPNMLTQFYFYMHRGYISSLSSQGAILTTMLVSRNFSGKSLWYDESGYQPFERFWLTAELTDLCFLINMFCVCPRGSPGSRLCVFKIPTLSWCALLSAVCQRNVLSLFVSIKVTCGKDWQCYTGIILFMHIFCGPKKYCDT